MLSVSRLSKSFNLRPVLREVTFDVKSGETIIFMGKNGAGKTTLLRILARIMTCDGGKILFQNKDLLKGSPDKRKKILYLGHAPAMYSSLSAVENLKLVMNLRSTPISEVTIRDQLERFDLLDQADDIISIYSQGMLQRLKLICAELVDWDLLLIDEPFTGLDELGEKQMKDSLNQWKLSGKTMCVVLHSRQKAEKYASRILYLEDGVIKES